MSFINNFVPILHSEDRKLLELPDCIHLSEYGKCSILSVASCRGGKCSFNQSAAAAQTSREHWKQHLRSMDAKRQKKIAHKYFGDAMPWKD